MINLKGWKNPIEQALSIISFILFTFPEFDLATDPSGEIEDEFALLLELSDFDSAKLGKDPAVWFDSLTSKKLLISNRWLLTALNSWDSGRIPVLFSITFHYYSDQFL